MHTRAFSNVLDEFLIKLKGKRERERERESKFWAIGVWGMTKLHIKSCRDRKLAFTVEYLFSNSIMLSIKNSKSNVSLQNEISVILF